MNYLHLLYLEKHHDQFVMFIRQNIFWNIYSIFQEFCKTGGKVFGININVTCIWGYADVFIMDFRGGQFNKMLNFEMNEKHPIHSIQLMEYESIQSYQ